jgi:hypothetical protein
MHLSTFTNAPILIEVDTRHELLDAAIARTTISPTTISCRSLIRDLRRGSRYSGGAIER